MDVRGDSMKLYHIIIITLLLLILVSCCHRSPVVDEDYVTVKIERYLLPARIVFSNNEAVNIKRNGQVISDQDQEMRLE
jgi:hypothetical protein